MPFTVRSDPETNANCYVMCCEMSDGTFNPDILEDILFVTVL